MPLYDLSFQLLDPEQRGARATTFRDEVMAAEWLTLNELALFGIDEPRLRALGFTDEDLRSLQKRY